MKTFLSAILAVLPWTVSLAGPDMSPPLVVTTFSTAVTNTATSPAYLSGWVDAIILDWTIGAGTYSQTGTVSIATVGGTGSGPSRTLLTLTATPCVDSVVYPRASASGTTGSTLTTVVGERIPLVQDKILVTVQDATQTNSAALTVRVITSPVP
jgi:hypothetical protein